MQGGEIGFQFRKWKGLTFGATGYWDILHHPISNVVTASNPITGDDAERTRVNLGGRGFAATKSTRNIHCPRCCTPRSYLDP